jgi:hypothetical protein
VWVSDHPPEHKEADMIAYFAPLVAATLSGMALGYWLRGLR